MALPYAVLAVMTFTTPDLGDTGKVIYAGTTYLLLMTVFTAINLPYSSLGAVMTADSYERTELNSYRFVFLPLSVNLSYLERRLLWPSILEMAMMREGTR